MRGRESRLVTVTVTVLIGLTSSDCCGARRRQTYHNGLHPRLAKANIAGRALARELAPSFTRSATHLHTRRCLEIGRAQRTVFVARYLRDRDLQREIEEGLNVVEARNGAKCSRTSSLRRNGPGCSAEPGWT
jgi:hypothetical protein